MCLFFYMVSPVKTQMENGLNKLFNLRGQTIDVPGQAVFTLKASVLHDEEVNKIKIRNLIKSTQRQSGSFCHCL